MGKVLHCKFSCVVVFLDYLLVHNEPLFRFGVDLIDVEEFMLILCIDPLEIFHLGHLADQSTLLSLRSQLQSTLCTGGSCGHMCAISEHFLLLHPYHLILN